MRKVKQDDGEFKEEAFGWRHQGTRASFMFVLNSVMLKLEPTYLLTKDDGKTPRTSRWVGPILSHWLNQERNGQILRSLRFWSLVIAGPKELTTETGQTRTKELMIETGQAPIVVDLTPISGTLGFGITSDQISFDTLMDAELHDDIKVPQLEMFGDESAIAYTEESQFPEDEPEDERASEG
jgi:hypothetical protein